MFSKARENTNTTSLGILRTPYVFGSSSLKALSAICGLFKARVEEMMTARRSRNLWTSWLWLLSPKKTLHIKRPHYLLHTLKNEIEEDL